MAGLYIKDKILVYVDGSSLINNPHSGIGQYTMKVIEHLSSYETLDVRVILFSNDRLNGISFPRANLVRLKLHRKIYMALWRVFPKLNVNKLLPEKPSWVIYPNFSMTPYISGVKSITVIHDLTYIHYPETVERRNKLFLRLAVKRSCVSSSYIVTPSKYTLSDLKEHFNPKAPMFIAQPGYSLEGVAASDKIGSRVAYVVNRPYCLFIGTIEPRKNLEIACKAYLRSKFAKKNIPFVLAGKIGWGNVELPINKNIIILGKVSDSEKRVLLNSATFFIFPSLFEGFGMPIIEAMHHKVPVISSHSSSLKEITNINYTYLFNEVDTEYSIVSTLDIAYSEMGSKKQREMIESAHSSVMSYTWTQTAKVFIDIICGKA